MSSVYPSIWCSSLCDLHILRRSSFLRSVWSKRSARPSFVLISKKRKHSRRIDWTTLRTARINLSRADAHQQQHSPPRIFNRSMEIQCHWPSEGTTAAEERERHPFAVDGKSSRIGPIGNKGKHRRSTEMDSSRHWRKHSSDQSVRRSTQVFQQLERKRRWWNPSTDFLETSLRWFREETDWTLLVALHRWSTSFPSSRDSLHSIGGILSDEWQTKTISSSPCRFAIPCRWKRFSVTSFEEFHSSSSCQCEPSEVSLESSARLGRSSSVLLSPILPWNRERETIRSLIFSVVSNVWHVECEEEPVRMKISLQMLISSISPWTMEKRRIHHWTDQRLVRFSRSWTSSRRIFSREKRETIERLFSTDQWTNRCIDGILRSKSKKDKWLRSPHRLDRWRNRQIRRVVAPSRKEHITFLLLK